MITKEQAVKLFCSCECGDLEKPENCEYFQHNKTGCGHLKYFIELGIKQNLIGKEKCIWTKNKEGYFETNSCGKTESKYCSFCGKEIDEP